ncbi:MAG: tetratricopeptide repeat protein [Betaproteobacteria bacterium]|nr:tetratricopeptide repeat protein [Betaproteobacteria bacterium]
MPLLQRLRAWFGGNRAARLEAAIRLHESGDLAGAEQRYRALLRADARDADATHLLGLIAHQRGDHAAAVAQIGAAIALKADKPVYHYNLGNALVELDRLEAAINSFRAALELDPSQVAARSNLAQALTETGRYAEAAAEYRRLLELQPSAAARNALARALIQCADADASAADCYDEAATLLQQAWQAADDPATARLALAYCHRQRERWTEAADHYQAVLELRPGNPAAHNDLANCCNQLGRIAEAILHYRETYRLAPDFPEALTGVLACLNYDPDCQPEQAAAEHRRWAEQVAARYYPKLARFDNDRDPKRRLRIGYVSPDFRRHPLTAIFAPVLDAHVLDQVEVYCYYNYASEDTVTLRLKQRAGHWRSIVELDDEALCAQIRADRIDILVDLAGHTSNNRLLAFARKPAPVQVTWLGYPNTTGLLSMDYRITDRYADPPGQERYYSEELVYMPDSMWCYAQQGDEAEVNQLPALQRGYVTFGSFNSFSKLGFGALDLWARLMRDIPRSRLLVVRAPEGAGLERLSAQFAAHGIGVERIELLGMADRTRYLELHHEVDMALDPFPCNGGATTCDALWMGVPVIALAGDRFVSRAGVSLLSAAGLTDWIAHNQEEYIGLAQAWSRNLPGLAELRAGMRGRLRASPLIDAKRFARNLEAAYRGMWEHHCASGNGVVKSRVWQEIG